MLVVWGILYLLHVGVEVHIGLVYDTTQEEEAGGGSGRRRTSLKKSNQPNTRGWGIILITMAITNGNPYGNCQW